ncbi:hypothetical protein BO70DRAFT_356633 [Aspergillus heteromorphus CBS 117.55]|uniref:Uncharacterized protein n=1 Tax=Aspergillus heteromorphus CBS 117.55 TaxID=1448321 RepID=A0A317UWF2_9EURO|nr:uncharacterized protein BO70DRAFT_356633 [Aspergillus heteromorphus CBS 117.55]PWY66005.1 hypothetical protein BO70DRAFT_356633 [Aspergillus heteromorphus CBS 117.55]
MSTARFRVTEHTIPACHIREYAGSTVQQEDVLHLHVKQYTPHTHRSNPKPVPAHAVTLIAAHAVGFPKELYEPLWDELLTRSAVPIRGIWIADVASMGTSGILNEDKLSMDCSWMDHPRDLLLMINHFRDQMPRPLVGIGHSFGGTIMCVFLRLLHSSSSTNPFRANLAYLHPRLFTAVIFLDPVMQRSPPNMGFGSDPPGPVNFVLWRDDVWPTRAAAATANRRMFKNWDPRCADRMVQFGFRDLPTALHPSLGDDADPANPPVTLTTTKHHDVLGQIRHSFDIRTPDGRIEPDRATHADLDPTLSFLPVYRPEPPRTLQKLPSLRPPALFLLAGASYLNLDQLREAIRTCGQGVGGSGGREKVKEITLPKRGHFFPFEIVGETAGHCAAWLDEVMRTHYDAERRWNEARRGMAKRDHLVLGDEWRRAIKPPGAFRSLKPRKDKL